MKFLSTVTALGNQVLIPINRIKHITFICNKTYIIRIVSDEADHEENYDEDEEGANLRFNMLKRALAI